MDGVRKQPLDQQQRPTYTHNTTKPGGKVVARSFVVVRL